MKKRVYGNENTMIRLTDKAQKFYDGSSPFRIFEYEDDAGRLTYSFAGFCDPETDRMTAEELTRNLEAMADDMDDGDAEKIFIQFEAGESRYTEGGAVNYMIARPDSDVDLYAEITVPDGASDDYGYLGLKSAILEQADDMGIPAGALEFWYDGQEDHLEPDAAASDGIRW